MKVREVKIGPLQLGGDAPVLIQSMTNTKTEDVKATLEQINALCEVGCDFVRVAVPSKDTIKAFKKIVKSAPCPIVADIHFDWRLAVEAIEAGASKVRVNPGNLGGLDKLREVARAASGRSAIRVGVNSGSIGRDYLAKIQSGEITKAEAMTRSAKDYVDFLYDSGFYDVVVSLKASDIPTTLSVNRTFRQICDSPLHLGITEAGTAFSGTIKSAVGLGVLLLEGIGETIRVSLTAPPTEEVKVAKEILKATGRRKMGPTIISCPTCGRTEIDLYTLATQVEKLTESIPEDITIAVMGCVVNGPGEAREADIGVAGGRGAGVIFVGGEIVEKVKEEDLFERFTVHLERLLQEKKQKDALK